jgi:hypothetical protein
MRAFVLAHILRTGLGLFFLIVAVLKLADLAAFEEAVGNFGIVPDATVRATAVVLVVLEGTAGLLLVVGGRGGLALAAALLVVFGAALSYGIAIGLDFDCGCLGLGESERGSLGSALARDLFLLALLALVRLLERRAGRAGLAVDAGAPSGGESQE